METPVTYFYSDKALSVTASVDFPKGVFTQWYPAVMGFGPKLAWPYNASNDPPLSDPALDVPAAILVGRVEEGDRAVERGEDRRDGPGRLDAVAIVARHAERAGTDADRRHLQPRPAQSSRFEDPAHRDASRLDPCRGGCPAALI